jgi:hypothetical protein
LTPKRDIDFILTFGIDIQSISTLGPDCPACSDHNGTPFDIDPEFFFLHPFSLSLKRPFETSHPEMDNLSTTASNMYLTKFQNIIYMKKHKHYSPMLHPTHLPSLHKI